MPLFLSLYLGHMLGDFVFQPGKLVIAKRTKLSGVLLHTGIVTTVTALVAAPHLSAAWPAIVIAGITHMAVEELTVRARKSPLSSDLTVFLLDQGLHVVVLALLAMAPWGIRDYTIGMWEISREAYLAVCGIVTAAFFGSIFVFEVRRATARSDGPGTTIMRLDAPRLYGMAERATALAMALFLPVPALGLLAFAPRLAYAYLGPRAARTGSLVAAASGAALCGVLWAAVELLSAT